MVIKVQKGEMYRRKGVNFNGIFAIVLYNYWFYLPSCERRNQIEIAFTRKLRAD
jgi:hypothetical protein